MRVQVDEDGETLPARQQQPRTLHTSGGLDEEDDEEDDSVQVEEGARASSSTGTRSGEDPQGTQGDEDSFEEGASEDEDATAAQANPFAVSCREKAV